MTFLHEKNCTACYSGAPQLPAQELAEGLARLREWTHEKVEGVDRLKRVYSFKNFALALQFTQVVGLLAEEFNHHPAILTEWGKVTVTWWTHKIRGVHENDLIMAAKTEHAFENATVS
jgi:4a-hydroxytetrahydrobiopterin dehydratase